MLLAFVAILGLTSCDKDEEPQGFVLSDTKLTIKVGERRQLSVTMDGIKQKVEHFTWYSSNVVVGDVNGSGQPFGKSKGKFIVKVEHDETQVIVGTCEVTVN